MKVCFHKTDITPTRPCRMGGYERKKESEGVLDTIELNTIALQLEDQLLLFAMIDCICLGGSFVDHIKEVVSTELAIQQEQIMISCIHTHSAPCFFKLTFEQVEAEAELTQALKEQVIEDLLICAKQLQPCHAILESCNIEGIYGNRNEIDAYSDKSFHVIRFFQEDTPLGILANISTHPTLLGADNHLLSADLLGQVRKQLEETYHTTVCISNGACGDVSTRFYRQQDDTIETTATQIMQQFLSTHTQLPLTLKTCKVCSVSEGVEVNFTTDEVHKKIRQRIEALDDSGMKQLFLHKCDIKESFGSFHMQLTSTIVITKQLILVTLPGDILSAFGKQIKDAFPHHQVLLICYTGNYCNYLVPQEQYGQYFETFNSRLPIGKADQFIQKVIETAKSNIYID